MLDGGEDGGQSDKGPDAVKGARGGGS